MKIGRIRDRIGRIMRTCAMYDTTIKAIGFDEIRVRYREQRRRVVREVILMLLIGSAMEEYISLQSTKLVKEEDRKAFCEDVLEDLKEIDQSRIVGLGITLDQLNAWINIRDR